MCRMAPDHSAVVRDSQSFDDDHDVAGINDDEKSETNIMLLIQI